MINLPAKSRAGRRWHGGTPCGLARRLQESALEKSSRLFYVKAFKKAREGGGDITKLNICEQHPVEEYE